MVMFDLQRIKPLNTELNPICHLLALLGARYIFHVSSIRVFFLTVMGLRCGVGFKLRKGLF